MSNEIKVSNKTYHLARLLKIVSQIEKPKVSEKIGKLVSNGICKKCYCSTFETIGFVSNTHHKTAVFCINDDSVLCSKCFATKLII